MRVLFFSNDFPQPHDPFRALFNFERCRALAGLHEVAVLSPSSWVERAAAWRAGKSVTPARRLSHFFDERHPVFYYVPGVLQSLHASCLWWSSRNDARTLIERFRPDVVLSYWTYPDGEVALRIAREAGVAAVCIVGGSDVMLAQPRSKARARVSRVLRQADAIVTVSKALQQRIAELGVDPSKIHLVAPAVDKAVFRPGDRDTVRRRLGLPISRPIAVWIGRLVAVKGLATLMDACAALHLEPFAFDLHLIGEGPLGGELKTRVAHLGLGSSVTFHEPLAPVKLADWFRAADVTVLPSLSEGMPNVLIESIACGTPFVASAVGGIPSLACPGLDVLVPPGDAAALASALRTALSARNGHPTAARSVVPGSWRDQARTISDVLERAVLLSMAPAADGSPTIEPATAARPSRVAGG